MKPKKVKILRNANRFQMRRKYVALMRKYKLLLKILKSQPLNSYASLQLFHVEQERSTAVEVLNNINLQLKEILQDQGEKQQWEISTEKIEKNVSTRNTEIENEEHKSKLMGIEPEKGKSPVKILKSTAQGELKQELSKCEQIEIESEEVEMKSTSNPKKNQSKKEQVPILSKAEKSAQWKTEQEENQQKPNKRNTKAKGKPRKNQARQRLSKPSKTKVNEEKTGAENRDSKQETRYPVDEAELISDTCFEENEPIEDAQKKTPTKVRTKSGNKEFSRKRTKNLDTGVSINDETMFVGPLNKYSRRNKSIKNKSKLGSVSEEDEGGEDKSDKLETTIKHNERPRRTLPPRKSILDGDSLKNQLADFAASSKSSFKLKFDR